MGCETAWHNRMRLNHGLTNLHFAPQLALWWRLVIKDNGMSVTNKIDLCI